MQEKQSRPGWSKKGAARALAWMIEHPGASGERRLRALDARLAWQRKQSIARGAATRWALVAALGLAGRALLWAAPQSLWAGRAGCALIARAASLCERVARAERRALEGVVPASREAGPRRL